MNKPCTCICHRQIAMGKTFFCDAPNCCQSQPTTEKCECVCMWCTQGKEGMCGLNHQLRIDCLPQPTTDEQKWINYIKEYCYTDDPEADHGEAVKALKLFLISLGYSKLIEEYEKVAKWYA